MMVTPAIDLRDGACVQLVGGDYAKERVRLDPTDALQRWIGAGFRSVHIVDLDAATGAGANTPVVSEVVALARRACLSVQVGGGLRDDAAVDRILADGASFAVVGTRAIDDPDWLASLTERHLNRIIVAADARNGHVLTRGWAAESALSMDALLDRCNIAPLAGILVTAVQREGLLAGPDLELLTRVRARADVPLIASGGIASVADLRALRDIGVDAAVVGMALYTGTLEPAAIAQEFVL
jgi:phosphoribosylformimino-5-aminoimidazole carboxamide ribotide isomerase